MMKQRLAIIGSTSVRKVLFLLSALSVETLPARGLLVGK